MIKQNQHLFRPFPHQNPQTTQHDQLSLNTNCQCPPCRSKNEKRIQQIFLDYDLDALKKNKNKSSVSDFIIFLDQIYKHSSKGLPHLPILDTIVFNNDGSIKYLVSFESEKLKMSKLNTTLKNFMAQRKYQYDLQFQKKKFQRQNLGFSFIQLDHQSQKYVKQFQNNIKFMSPLLNRVAITKSRNKQQQQILTQNQINNLFVKFTRKLFDFTKMEYMQIFPIMYGHQEISYVRKIKYFRDRQINKKNFKIAQHYMGNWYSKNQTLSQMQKQFLASINKNQDQTLLYYTYKLFNFYQKVSNKMVEHALLHFITNDEGNSFYLKKIQYFKVLTLHEVEERVRELPKKLQNTEIKKDLNLKNQMIYQFDYFQRNFDKLKKEGELMEEKRLQDAKFSNNVYESLGYKLPQQYKSQSFIKHISDKYTQEDNKLSLSDEQIELSIV